MNSSRLRPCLFLGVLIALLFTSGCAHVIDGLNQVAYELDQQNQRQAEAAYYQACYGPRLTGDTSAPGIK